MSRSSKAKLVDTGAAAEPYGTQQRTIEAVSTTHKVLDSGAGPSASPKAAPAYNSFNPYENAAAEERQVNPNEEEDEYTPATEEKDTPAFEGAVKR